MTKGLIYRYFDDLHPLIQVIKQAYEGSKVCIIFHNHIPRADTDTLSAAVSLWMIFKYLRKFPYHNLRIMGSGKAEGRALNTLQYFQNILKDEKFKVEFIEDPENMETIYCNQLIVVDTDFERAGFKPSHFKVKDNIIILDHHPKLDDIKLLEQMKESSFCKIDQINCSILEGKNLSSSTSQLMFPLIQFLQPFFKELMLEENMVLEAKEFGKDFLQKYYKITRAGIQTDTGGFSYSKTDNALLCVGKFLENFEDFGPFEIEQSEFSNVTQLKYSKADLDTIRKIYDIIDITDDGIVSLVCDSKDFYHPAFGIYSTLSPIHFCQNFKHIACIAIRWETQKDHSIIGKIELRSSSEKYPIRPFALRYGGNGHSLASGAMVKLDKEHAIEFELKSNQIIAEFKKYIREECK